MGSKQAGLVSFGVKSELQMSSRTLGRGVAQRFSLQKVVGRPGLDRLLGAI